MSKVTCSWSLNDLRMGHFRINSAYLGSFSLGFKCFSPSMFSNYLGQL